MSEQPRKLLSPEEIEQEINDLARHGEGSDKRWALNKLSTKAEGEVVLPPVYTDKELIHRLAKLMRGAGLKQSKAAFVIAFENHPAQKQRRAPLASELEIDVDVALLPKTLKQYYNRYPHTKKAGFPKGYPQLDPVKQMQWVQNQSVLRERELATAKAADIVADIQRFDETPKDGESDTGPEAA